jgi:hypothetical protein
MSNLSLPIYRPNELNIGYLGYVGHGMSYVHSVSLLRMFLREKRQEASRASAVLTSPRMANRVFRVSRLAFAVQGAGGFL